eukprot:6463890-Amphidinium_carterae.1
MQLLETCKWQSRHRVLDGGVTLCCLFWYLSSTCMSRTKFSMRVAHIAFQDPSLRADAGCSHYLEEHRTETQEVRAHTRVLKVVT